MKLNLTKASVDALPPAPEGKTQELHYDSKLAGFGVYVTPKGVKTYFVEGRVKGRPRTVRKKIGRHGAIFPDAAREDARSIIFAMSKGELIDKKEKAKTFSELAASYIAERSSGAGRNIKHSTADQYSRILANQLSKWSDTPITDFTKELVRKIHNTLTKENGPTMANTCMRMMRAVFNYYDIEPNPVRELSKKRLWNPNNRRTRYIESENLASWIKSIESVSVISRTAILVMLFLGFRKMEAFSLRKSQYRNGCLYLEEGTTKNGDAHVVPVGPYLKERIELVLKIEKGGKEDWLFPSSSSKTGHISDVSGAIASAGLMVSPHDLRRTFVSHLNALEPAPSQYTIKRLMNHRQDKRDVTAGYILIEEKKLLEVITRLEASMLGSKTANP